MAAEIDDVYQIFGDFSQASLRALHAYFHSAELTWPAGLASSSECRRPALAPLAALPPGSAPPVRGAAPQRWETTGSARFWGRRRSCYGPGRGGTRPRPPHPWGLMQ